MTRITVSLGERDAALLTERALGEGRSVSQMARVLIERGLGASEGDEGVAAPAVAAAPPPPGAVISGSHDELVAISRGEAPPPDTPETVAVKAKQARAVMERAQQLAGTIAEPVADAASDVDPPTPAEEKTTPREPPPSVPQKSIDEVLGDPKHKPKGTVSSRQAVLAAEAARRAAEGQDAFSLVCPNRNEHVAGVRCGVCKGIR